MLPLCAASLSVMWGKSTPAGAVVESCGWTSCASGSTCIRQGWAGQMLSREPEQKHAPNGRMNLRMLCEVTKTALRLTGDVGLTQLPRWVLTLTVCVY